MGWLEVLLQKSGSNEIDMISLEQTLTLHVQYFERTELVPCAIKTGHVNLRTNLHSHTMRWILKKITKRIFDTIIWYVCVNATNQSSSINRIVEENAILFLVLGKLFSRYLFLISMMETEHSDVPIFIPNSSLLCISYMHTDTQTLEKFHVRKTATEKKLWHDFFNYWWSHMYGA